MKMIIKLILLMICLKLALSEEPALKINLNPPEEDVKDTISIYKYIIWLSQTQFRI